MAMFGLKTLTAVMLASVVVPICPALPTVTPSDGTMETASRLQVKPEQTQAKEPSTGQQGEKSAILNHLENLGNRLEKMERRFAKVQTDSTPKSTILDGDVHKGGNQLLNSTAPSLAGVKSINGGDGDGIGLPAAAHNQILQMLELMGSKIDKIDSRQELFVNRIMSKIDLRVDETHTLLAEVIGKVPKAVTGGTQQDGVSEASNIEASQATPLVNTRELAKELTRELTSLFASWTTNVVDELTKGLYRITEPFHKKIPSDISELRAKVFDMVIGLDDVRTANTRLEQSLSDHHRDTTRRHEATADKFTQLQEDIYQADSGTKVNFESTKLMLSQRFLDIESELRHQRTHMKEMETRLQTKVAESINEAMNESDNCVMAAHNVSRQMERQYHEQQQNPMYAPSAFASAAAQSAAAAATSAAATQTIHAAATMQQVQQQNGLFPHFYPLGASTQRVAQQLTQTQLKIHQQQQQMAQLQYSKQHMPPSGVVSPFDPFEQGATGEAHYFPDPRGTSRESASTNPGTSPGINRELSGMDRGSVLSDDAPFFQHYQERQAREFQELHERTNSLDLAVARGSARLGQFETTTRHFMGKIINMFSELSDGHTKVYDRLGNLSDEHTKVHKRLDNLSAALEATRLDVRGMYDEIANLPDRPSPGGGRPSKSNPADDGALKKRLREMNKAIEDQFKSLNTELGMLGKCMARAEHRERNNADVLDSTLEMLVKLVNNRNERCKQEQTQLEIMLNEHSQKVGQTLDISLKNISEMFQIFYIALADIESKIANLSRVSGSNTAGTTESSGDVNYNEEYEDQEGSGLEPVTVVQLGLVSAGVGYSDVTTPQPTINPDIMINDNPMESTVPTAA